MSTPPAPPRRSTEADCRKAAALDKLRQARNLIRSAGYDLQDLEGEGYCAQWEQLPKLEDTVQERAEKIAALKPPTGVFRW